MDPEAAYFKSMMIIRSRFIAAEIAFPDETPLAKAERLALHVRKIVEGVSLASLSAAEARNGHRLPEQRTKDADKLLDWLEKKKMLELPAAQRFGIPTNGATVLEGGEGAARGLDLSAKELRKIYSRASDIVHEKHPERLTPERVSKDLKNIGADVAKLRAWLWLHIIFLKNAGFLVQMGQFGTESFMVNLSKA